MFPHIMSDTSITVFIDGAPTTFDHSHPNFAFVEDAIANEDWAAVQSYINIPDAIEKYAKGLVTIDNGMVMYDGEEVHNVVSHKILACMGEGFPFEHIVKFLNSVKQNPSRSSVEELYIFLESNDLPITEDGHFLAYKRVTDTYKDKHTGKFDNSIGAKPSMKRNDVDDRRDVTCSKGLHFCALKYAEGFGQGPIMVLKINPKDVVSIPNDYNNQKGRCSDYEVVAEYSGKFKSAVVDPKDLSDDYDSHDYYAETQYVGILLTLNSGWEDKTYEQETPSQSEL